MPACYGTWPEPDIPPNLMDKALAGALRRPIRMPRPLMTTATATSGRLGPLSESVMSSVLDQAPRLIRQDGAHGREPR